MTDREEIEMKKGKLILFAFSPLLVGIGMNGMMIKWNWYGASMTLISIIFSIYWIYGGYRSFECSKSRLKSNLLGNGFAIVSIGVILLQLALLGRFMMNFMCFAPQMFFLPTVRMVAILRRVLFFLPVNSTFGIVSMAFLFMLLLYNIGYTLGVRKG